MSLRIHTFASAAKRTGPRNTRQRPTRHPQQAREAPDPTQHPRTVTSGKFGSSKSVRSHRAQPKAIRTHGEAPRGPPQETRTHGLAKSGHK